MSQAKELLLAAANAYANFRSYQDAGEVRSSGLQSEVQMTATFVTRFAGPARFQFRFESPHPSRDLSTVVSRHVIGVDDVSPYHWSMTAANATARVEEVSSVDIAIAGATGISFGAAHTTGQLLFRRMDDWTNRLVDWEALDDATEDGVACHVVRGERKAAKRQTVFYLDKHTLLLRKLVTEHENFTSEEVRRDIRTDGEIAAPEFVRPAV